MFVHITHTCLERELCLFFVQFSSCGDNRSSSNPKGEKRGEEGREKRERGRKGERGERCIF